MDPRSVAHRPSPHPKHCRAWCLQRSLLVDARTRKNRTLKKLGQADQTLLKIAERRDELASAIVDSPDPMDLELLNLQHIIVLKLKARAERDAAHASQKIADVISDIASQQEQHLLLLAQRPPPPPLSEQGHNHKSRKLEMTSKSADVQAKQVTNSLDYWTLFEQTSTSQQEQHLLVLADRIPPPPSPLCQQGHNPKARKIRIYSKLTLAQKVEIIRRRDSPHAWSKLAQLARDFQVPFHHHSTFRILQDLQFYLTERGYTDKHLHDRQMSVARRQSESREIPPALRARKLQFCRETHRAPGRVHVSTLTKYADCLL